MLKLGPQGKATKNTKNIRNKPWSSLIKIKFRNKTDVPDPAGQNKGLFIKKYLLYASSNINPGVRQIRIKEPPNIWLTVAKNAFVGWALSFGVRMLLKGAINEKS